MKLFIWHGKNVLTSSLTPGIAVAYAADLDHAKALIRAQYIKDNFTEWELQALMEHVQRATDWDLGFLSTPPITPSGGMAMIVSGYQG